MMRVYVSVGVVAALTAAYVVNPLAGWLALGTTFVFLLSRRGRKTGVTAAEAEAG